MKKISKILSVVLCLAMVLSFALVAHAEEAELPEITKADTLVAGDKVYLYYPEGKQFMTAEANGKKLKGVEMTATEGVELVAGAAELVVAIDEDGYYTFTCGGKYLTSGNTGNHLYFADEASDYSLWTLEAAENGWYIKNVNAVYYNKNQAIEFYSGFTTYGFKADKIYVFQFFKAVVEDENGGIVIGGGEDGTVVTEAKPCATHGKEAEDTIVFAPTCDEWGCTLHYCTKCDHSYTTDYKPATGHIYEVTETTTSSCMEEGYSVYTCTGCGDSYETERAFGAHEITASSEGFEATCTEDGIVEYYYCGTCNVYFADAELTTKMEDQTGLNLVIPASHEITASSEGFAATCTEEGMVEYYYCGTCNVYFADAELTTKMEDQTGLNLVIAALGHEITSFSEGFAATCTEEGLVAYWYCGTCNVYFADAELTTEMEDQTGLNLALPVAEHVYGEDGLCTACGAEDPSYVAPTNPSEPEETKPVNPDENEPSKTGDASILFAIFGMLSMGGASALVLKKKYN